MHAFVQRLGQEILDQEALRQELDTFYDVLQRQELPLSVQQRGIVDCWLICLRQVCVALQSVEPDLVALGKAWVRLASATAQLYLPNVPVDPIVRQRTGQAFAAVQEDRLGAQIKVEEQVIEQVTNNATSSLLASLQHQLQEVVAQRSVEIKAPVSREPDLVRLTQLFRELRSFVTEVVQLSKLEKLLSSLENGNDRAYEQEQSLQASLSGFAHRLKTVYSSLQDLVAPFLLALDQIRLGLSTVRQGALARARDVTTAKHELVVEALTSFPSASATSQYSKLDLPVRLKLESRSSALAAPLLLTAMAAIEHDVSNGAVLSRSLGRLSRLYDQFYQLWVLDREREEKTREEEASLYKSRKEDLTVLSDVELEEKEFKELFPEFGDTLEDEELGVSFSSAHAAKSKRSTSLLQPSHIQQVWSLHTALFGSGKDQGGSHFGEDRLEVVQRIIESSSETLKEGLDKASAVFQVSLLGYEAGMVNDSPASAKKDFYKSPDLKETAKAVPILQRLREKLSSLIKEWPEQMVLQHIRDRCDAILRLDSASPVAKVLAAFEQLLLHTEDWESYASSATSLKANRSEISSIIVEWRRLELSSWAQLLEVQKAIFSQSVADWWFRLFEVAIRGFQSARTEGKEAEDEHLRKLIGLLDEFVRSSKLGEFDARLGLLRSFARFLDMLLESAPAEEVAGLDRVAVVLSNVNAFYQQFQAKVDSSLSQQRDVLERNIRDFIKLASWKDVNIHALKQSAQKTHRQLHKCIRRFRDVLRQPVDPLLAINMDGSGKDKFVQVSSGVSRATAPRLALDLEALKALSNQPSLEPTAPHLLDLAPTLTRLRKLADTRVVPSLLQEQGAGLNALAGEIVARSQALAKLTPAFSKEDNAKTIKNLTTRKRKAWTDLLKELRRIGFTSYLRAEIPERHQDAVYVYTQQVPFASPSHPLPEALVSAEQYHYRLLASLPRLRDSLRTSSGDLPVAELQRGVAFAEYAMSLGFAERGRLAELLKKYSSIDSIAQRLGGTHDANKGRIATCTDSAPSRLEALSDFVSRIDASLKEIRNEMGLHLRLSPFGQHGADGFASQLSQLQSKASALSQRLSQLVKAISLLPVPLLFQDEITVVDEAQSLVESASDCLHSFGQNSPALEQLCRPAVEWIQKNVNLLERSRLALQPRAAADGVVQEEAAFSHQADRLISSILVVVQDLCKAQEESRSSEAEVQDPEDLSDKAIPEQLKQLSTFEHCLRAETISSELSSLFSLSKVLPSEPSELSRSLARLAPFLREYASLLKAHIEASSAWQRSLLKLIHVLTSMVTSLASKGFCQPPPEEQIQNADGDGGEQLEGGTGLGDGTGAQDVTDQMDDDEVMEELQKDETEKDEKKDGDSKQEKSAREADEDFGGELEDVSEGEEGDEDDKGEEEEQEEQDHDEQVGDVDPLDPNAVDEKMWGGEDDDKEDDKGQDKTEKELQDQDQGEEESVAKDEKNQKKDNKKEKKGQEQAADKDQGEDGKEEGQEEDTEGNPEDEEKEDENGEGEGDEGRDAEEEEEEEETTADGLGRRLDQETKEGENLDLNEDIDMGEDQGSASDSMGMSDDDEGMDDLPPPEDDPSRKQEEDTIDVDDEAAREELDKLQDQQGEQPEESAEPEVSRNEGEDPADEDDAGEEDEVEGETGADQMDIDSQPQDGPQLDSNDAGMDPNEDMDAQPMGDVNEGASAQFEQSSRGTQGRQVQAVESQATPKGQQDDNAQPEPSNSAQDVQPTGGDGRTEKNENQDETAETKPEEQAEADSNPIRSLGDALKDFRRNLDAIQGASQDADEERPTEEVKDDGEGMPQSSDVEHIKNDEEAELQAMGDAKEEEQQAQKLGSIEDGTDEIQKAEDTQEAPPQEAQSALEPAQLPDAGTEDENSEANQQQKALLSSDIKSRSEKQTEQGQDRGENERDEVDPATDPFAADGAQLDEAMSPLPEEYRHEADIDIEQQLADFKSLDAEERATRAADLWRQYSSLTSDLSFALCEQLRLILVPTLATRLNGDYRTGKRLNMRKIVPFIASDFAKDKIWLRRTKPSSREYQVLLAVDDSRSMAESRSSHLAYQTLALVSGALGRLEVGDVGICRFGETVETLHQFGKGTFSEDDGARVIDRLSFEQRGTNVLKLVENSLEVLQEARESKPSSSASAGSELWQLQIIISDGVCQVSVLRKTVISSFFSVSRFHRS